MGVKARCCPCHSAAHCRHMKRQPPLCHCCCCHGHHNCDRRCRLRCHCCLHCRRRCRSLLPSPLPLAIAIVVAIAHHRRRLCHVAISHHNCCRPPPRSQPLPSLSLLAIAVAISIGHHHCRCITHCRELLPWRGKNCIQTI